MFRMTILLIGGRLEVEGSLLPFHPSSSLYCLPLTALEVFNVSLTTLTLRQKGKSPVMALMKCDKSTEPPLLTHRAPKIGLVINHVVPY